VQPTSLIVSLAAVVVVASLLRLGLNS
jgi:hypothetical protein